MNILYVNTYYYGGGAEAIARKLYEQMPEEVHTFFLAGRIQPDLPEGVTASLTGLADRSLATLQGMNRGNTTLRVPKTTRKMLELIREEQIDIVHFHNMHGNYFGIDDFGKIADACRGVVVTMHDMWTFTGCCPYGMSCRKWVNPAQKQEAAGQVSTGLCRGCCGNEAIVPRKDAVRLLQHKQAAFCGQGVHFVSPSRWLSEEASHSILQDEDVRTIPNGIDVGAWRTFTDTERREARRKYGIEDGRVVLLFAANRAGSPYKGYSILRQALRQMKNPEKYTCLIIGQADESKKNPRKNQKSADIGRLQVIYTGYIHEQSQMNELYAMSDLFLLPSLADTYPTTVMESEACGTPVLAFRTGGIAEQITPETGWLVDPVIRGKELEAAERLCFGIEEVFADGTFEVEKRRPLCRRFAQEHFDERRMLDGYLRLYQEILHS